MPRILLADDSPHAQRMGERILREEGFEVVSVADGQAALDQIHTVDPDVIVTDVFLPGKSGLDICRQLKSDPAHAYMRIVLTAGLLDTFDEEEGKRAGCDAILKKPFEASKLTETVQPLVKDAALARERMAEMQASAAAIPTPTAGEPAPEALPASDAIDAERVRAAVTLALDAAMPAMIREITERVLIALGH